jgi:hypothetical protein
MASILIFCTLEATWKMPFGSYDKFHEVAKNIEGYFLKELSYYLAKFYLIF